MVVAILMAITKYNGRMRGLEVDIKPCDWDTSEGSAEEG